MSISVSQLSAESAIIRLSNDCSVVDLNMPIMKTAVSCLALASALILSAGPAVAAKDGYYRWQDDQGEYHFTQQPPLGRSYEFVESDSGASFSRRSDDAEEDGGEAETQGDDSGTGGADPQPAKMEVLPPKDPAICAQAKSNLQSMQNNAARIRMTDENGNTRFLTPEEKEEQKARAQEAIRIHCD